MVAFGSLDVEIECTRRGVGADSCIARVGKRARLPIAEACHIMLVTAEGLVFRREPGLGVSTSKIRGN